MAIPKEYDGRGQALVKHTLLKEYLPEWAYKVGRKWEKLAYVDAFAGPWKVADENYSDSSFGVAINTLKRALNGLRNTHNCPVHMQAVLGGLTTDDRKELEKFATKNRVEGFDIDTVQGEFVTQIPTIDTKIAKDQRKAFRFVLLDPKGWKDIPMAEIAPFLNARGCEVLINLMTSFITRFLNEPTREDSYHRLFGRPEVLDLLRQCPNELKEEVAVLEYAKSLRVLCNFRYVSCAVIMHPEREATYYYLMFGTNHAKGIEVFKTAEIEAAKLQNDVRIDTQAQKDGVLELALDGDGRKTRLVHELRQRFCSHARRAVLRVLVENAHVERIPYRELYCEAMAFPLVTPEDLASWLQTLACINFVIGGRKRAPSPDDDRDFAVVIDESDLRNRLLRAAV